MDFYLIWIPLFLSALSGLAALISCRIQLTSMQRRVVFLEREVFLVRVREERQEQKLQEVFGALTLLKKDTDGLLHGLGEKLDIILLNSPSSHN